MSGCVRAENGYVFGKDQNTGLAVKLDAIGREKCEFDFAGLYPKPSHHVANRNTPLQLAHQRPSIGESIPDLQILDRAPEDLVSRAGKVSM